MHAEFDPTPLSLSLCPQSPCVMHRSIFLFSWTLKSTVQFTKQPVLLFASFLQVWIWARGAWGSKKCQHTFRESSSRKYGAWLGSGDGEKRLQSVEAPHSQQSSVWIQRSDNYILPTTDADDSSVVMKRMKSIILFFSLCFSIGLLQWCHPEAVFQRAGTHTSNLLTWYKN